MSRRSERGAALLIAIVVVLVVSVLAVGAIRFASREVSGAIAAKKEAALAACAEAARTMLMSKWKLLGEQTWSEIKPLKETIETVTPTVLLGGHYGDVDISGVQIVEMKQGITGPVRAERGIENTILDNGGSPANYQLVVHCTQGQGRDARELEVEFAVNFGL